MHACKKRLEVLPTMGYSDSMQKYPLAETGSNWQKWQKLAATGRLFLGDLEKGWQMWQKVAATGRSCQLGGAN